MFTVLNSLEESDQRDKLPQIEDIYLGGSSTSTTHWVNSGFEFQGGQLMLFRLHLVVGRLGTSTGFFNRFAPGRCTSAALPQHSDVPLRSPGRHPGTQFLCSFVCCLTTEDMLQLSKNNWNFFFSHGISSTNRNSQLNWIQMSCWDYLM